MQTLSTTFKWMFIALLSINIVLIGFLSYFLLTGEKVEEMQLKRINVVDNSGNNRVVISNPDRIPPPIIKGKSYKRKVNPAGIIFYDKNGDERGGIAISENEEGNINALAFDYQNADAIGIFSQDDKENTSFKAGLIINDKDLSGKPGQNVNRIRLMTENGNASLIIKDANEVPRLILAVDSLGNPSFTLIDKTGKKQQYLP